MTRRELAKYLSKDLIKRGPHYVSGTTVYQTIDGHWGGYVGLHAPPSNAEWYEHVGWDVVAERNTAGKVETRLRDLERKFMGKAPRVRRRT
jgi:hypothetical protein